jgi:hypothetical protein
VSTMLQDLRKHMQLGGGIIDDQNLGHGSRFSQLVRAPSGGFGGVPFDRPQ